LVEVAYNLIRNKIPCKVEGRKIGEGLIKLATRWKVKTVGTLINKLEAYKEKEIEKYKKKENESMCQVIEDQVETLAVFIDQCKVDDPISTLNQVRFKNCLMIPRIKRFLYCPQFTAAKVENGIEYLR
jgi:hypothetical protein